MQQKQSGSAHLIITVILVVALLGALGFIFWQNFINKKDSTATTTTTTTTTATSTTPAATMPVNDNLVISQWGVTVPAKGFILISPSADNVGVTTQAIIDEAKRINCSDNGIGTIFRTKSTADFSSFTPVSAQINGYYYGYIQPSQAACTDNQGNPAATINSLMTDAEAVLKAAIVNTKAS